MFVVRVCVAVVAKIEDVVEVLLHVVVVVL